MTAIEPISQFSALLDRYVNANAPAGLVALSKKTPIAASPEAMMGSALPVDPLLWRMYDSTGKLATIPTGTSFMARV